MDPRLLMASERQARIILRENLPLADISTLRKIGAMYPAPARSDGEFVTQFDRVNSMISGKFPSLSAHTRLDIQLQYTLSHGRLWTNLQLQI